jgi:hypothetical protein
MAISIFDRNPATGLFYTQEEVSAASLENAITTPQASTVYTTPEVAGYTDGEAPFKVDYSKIDSDGIADSTQIQTGTTTAQTGLGTPYDFRNSPTASSEASWVNPLTGNTEYGTTAQAQGAAEFNAANIAAGEDGIATNAQSLAPKQDQSSGGLFGLEDSDVALIGGLGNMAGSWLTYKNQKDANKETAKNNAFNRDLAATDAAATAKYRASYGA